ncbi:hypothetical protein BBI01_19080 [Chryseobacterium artocarpi]|uniref:Lipoprotein n=1 Tax=Chryseobacterium artocarpi TaxID=1414727 RepID=A0A1B8ZAB9_9FLAO|nr:hypothetical protein [Chryseobacterium artocarpi]OCA68542.1 hypothetical protein BBI01_19080 [Chryseobacterium artocarpi]
MKKTILLFLISLIMLQSCSVNSEIVYHKDSALTYVTDIDTREFMAEMMAMTPDSLKQKEFGEMDKLPTTWTSLYDLAKQEGKLKTENPDTIKIMKKVLMKSIKENNKPAGISFKIEHFTPEDHQSLKNFTKEEKLPLDQNVYSNWDGKNLTINTDNFNLKPLEAAIRTKSTKEDAEKMEGMMMMFFKNIATTLRFENKIKSISGKHDWLKQIDDYSIRVEYDLKTLYNKDGKFKNADKKITIVTEQ